MQDNSQPHISVTQALNQIQSWLNAGEHEKVIQGCQEILEIEPGSQRALALMRKAEEDRHAADQSAPANEPEPANAPAPANEAVTEPNPSSMDEPIQAPTDPLADLQVETPSESQAPTEEPMSVSEPSSFTSPFTPEDEMKAEEKEIFRAPEAGFGMSEKPKLFLAMLIPAILVVLIGGGIIWGLSDRNHEEEVTSFETKDVSYLEANEERVEVLTTLEGVLDMYKDEHGQYPSAKKIEDVIEDNEYFGDIPQDARHGEFDKSGKVFGYMYAVYDTAAGDNTAYIVSALFEDSRGFGYAWTRGASTKLYDGYRNADSDDVTFIGEDKVNSTAPDSSSSSTNSGESGPKVKAE